MAWKLTKAEQARLDELRQRLHDSALAVEQEIDEFGAAVEEAKEHVQQKVEAYNSILRELADWRDEFVTDKRGEWDEKSAKWQAGENGQAADDWILAFEDLTLDDIEIDWPEELQAPDMDHASDVENLPEGSG